MLFNLDVIALQDSIFNQYNRLSKPRINGSIKYDFAQILSIKRI